jgi:hypothetical protein
MTLFADNVASEVRILTFADRVSQIEAQSYFQAGGAVLVSEFGRESSQPVYRDTTFHTSITIAWADLAHHVRDWRARHPNQRYYALRPVDPSDTGREIASLLAGLTATLADVGCRDRDDRDDDFDAYTRDVALAHTLSLLLTSTAALRANGVSGRNRRLRLT